MSDSKSKNAMSWIEAVKKCRDEGVFHGKIPKRGSAEYMTVRKVMESGKLPKKRGRTAKAKAKQEKEQEE